MKKRRILSVLCSFVVFSLVGCSGKSEPLPMPFAKQGIGQSISIDSKNDSTNLSFLSDNLCIVPVGNDVGNDTSITGISSLLFDISDKNVLYANNIYQRIYPASLTKIMTAIIAMEHGKLDDVVTVTYNASHITESGAKLCGLKEGDKIVLKDLLTVFLIYSGNDAGIAIADHIAGSEQAFAELMNQKAKEIGAVDTHFVNSHGLHDENHYTTAYDIYLMFQQLVQYSELKDMIQMKSYQMNYINADGKDCQVTYSTTNQYLKGNLNPPDGITVIGGKTGTTNAAGHCLTILVNDSKGKEYVALVLKAEGSDSLYKQMNQLLSKIG